MLESAAYRVLSRAAHLVLSRIELELRYHGGKENGRLPVTYEDFRSYGLHHRDAIAPALRELAALGFIEITAPGRGGNAEHRTPNHYRLTYEHTRDGNPTNEWKRFPPDMMAVAEHAAHMARQNKIPSPDSGPGAEPGFRARKRKIPEPGFRATRVTSESGPPLDTIGGARSPNGRAS
jgi:hypothetical protein